MQRQDGESTTWGHDFIVKSLENHNPSCIIAETQYSFYWKTTFRLLWSQGPSGKCAKLHTVAASNKGDHARQRSLYYCLIRPLA